MALQLYCCLNTCGSMGVFGFYGNIMPKHGRDHLILARILFPFADKKEQYFYESTEYPYLLASFPFVQYYYNFIHLPEIASNNRNTTKSPQYGLPENAGTM